jgi:hypothetical protein
MTRRLRPAEQAVKWRYYCAMLVTSVECDRMSVALSSASR